MKLVKKITMASVNNIRGGFKNVDPKGASFLGMRVVGLVRGYDTLVSPTMGESQKFYGEIRAENREGEEFASPCCFVPEPAQGLLRSAVDAADGLAVEFGFDILVVPDAESMVGYHFDIVPLLETKPSDALLTLTNRIKNPALAAPTSEVSTHSHEEKHEKAHSDKKGK